MFMHTRLNIDIRLIWICALILVIINQQVGFEKERIEQFNAFQRMSINNKIQYEKFGKLCISCDKFGNESMDVVKFYNQQTTFEKFKNKKNII